ncbi:MAG: hypothetical protein ACJ77K_07275 [Bacteroidia bacterium]
MELKKIIRNGVLLFIVTALIYLGVMFVLVNVRSGRVPLVYKVVEGLSWKGGNSYRKFIDFDKKAHYNVLVLGSSHAYRGYDPRIFAASGYTMFNLGTSGQSLLNSYYIATEYIDAGSCDLLILDIYDGALSGDGFESGSDLLQNISSDRAAFRMGLSYKDPRMINMLTVRMMSKSQPPLYVDSLYAGNGFSEKWDSLTTALPAEAYKTKFRINERQLCYLDQLLAYLQRIKMPVVLVSHPSPKERDQEDHVGISRTLKALCTKYRLQYLDYSFDGSLDTRKHFYDSHHLNQAGVILFNKVLLNDLKKDRYLH